MQPEKMKHFHLSYRIIITKYVRIFFWFICVFQLLTETYLGVKDDLRELKKCFYLTIVSKTCPKTSILKLR